MKISDLAILISVTAIWGINFSLIKIGLRNFDPYLLAAIRFTLCALPAVFFVARPAVAWRFLISYGMVFGALQWGLIYAGLQLGVSPGIASLVTQTAVFMTMGLGVFFFKERIERALLLGTLISFCGILLIFLNTEGQASLLGLFLVVGGAAGWAISNVIVKKSKSTEMFAFLIWSSLFAPLPLILMSFCVSGMDKISASITHIDSAAIASIAFQVYPTTLLGYSVWNHFMRKYPVSSVAPLALFVPVFGILASVVIFHESLPGYKIVAMLCIFSGLLVQRFGGIVLDRKTVA